jgi:hypothetical protein
MKGVFHKVLGCKSAQTDHREAQRNSMKIIIKKFNENVKKIWRNRDFNWGLQPAG